MADNWWSNPGFKKFASEALQDFGYGLSNSTNLGNAFGAATNRMQQMEPYRAEIAQQEEEEAKLAEQGNVTRSWLEHQGFTDLVPLVDAGKAEFAFGEALKRMQPGYGQAEAVRPIEVNGQLVNPMTGEVLGDYRDPQSGFGNAPSGYQWNQDGTQSFIPGGPADPSTQAKTTEAQRRNQQLASVIQPELAAVEQNWSELSSGTNQAGGMVPGVGNALTSSGYQQASNSLATIAQSYLYSVSGAAATDAEVRKIVDSVTPKPFESQQSIDAKLARIRQMADAVIQAGGGGVQQQAPGGQTSTGLQWSIEP
jgi:hypothetical protein